MKNTQSDPFDTAAKELGFQSGIHAAETLVAVAEMARDEHVPYSLIGDYIRSRGVGVTP